MKRIGGRSRRASANRPSIIERGDFIMLIVNTRAFVMGGVWMLLSGLSWAAVVGAYEMLA